MIRLTQLNKVEFIVNCAHIETIYTIPESKVMLQNKTFFIVTETPDEIIQKVIDFYSSIRESGAELAMKPPIWEEEEES